MHSFWRDSAVRANSKLFKKPSKLHNKTQQVIIQQNQCHTHINCLNDANLWSMRNGLISRDQEGLKPKFGHHFQIKDVEKAN